MEGKAAVSWRPFEIHPDVPPGGAPLSSLPYTPDEMEAMRENLQRHAAMEGLDFSGLTAKTVLSNTHRALMAGAYAQREESERFNSFHTALFQAHFGAGKNLGDTAVLAAAAEEAGLDVARMEKAVDSGVYESFLQSAAAEAKSRTITAVPAFLFGGVTVIVGAHPVETLARAFKEALAVL